MASIIRSFTPAAQPRSSWGLYVSHAIRVMSQMFRCVSGAVPKRQEQWKSESESSTNLSVHPIKDTDRPSSRNLGFMSCNDMMCTWKWSYTNNNNKKNNFFFKRNHQNFYVFTWKKQKENPESAGPSFVTTEGPELSRQLRSSTNRIPLMWRSTSAKGGQGRQGGNPAWDSFFLLFSQFNQRDKTATGGWYKEKTSKVEVRLTTWHRLLTFWGCVFETWVWRFHRACLHNRAGILSPETAALQTGAAASPGASPSPPDRGGAPWTFIIHQSGPVFWQPQRTGARHGDAAH